MEKETIAKAYKFTLLAIDYVELMSKNVKKADNLVVTVGEMLKGANNAFASHLVEEPVEDGKPLFSLVDFNNLSSIVHKARRDGYLNAIPTDGDAYLLLAAIGDLTDTVKPLTENERDRFMNGCKSIVLDHAQRFIDDESVILASSNAEHWSTDHLVMGLRSYLQERY